jgi:hypothetical protein
VDDLQGDGSIARLVQHEPAEIGMTEAKEGGHHEDGRQSQTVRHPVDGRVCSHRIAMLTMMRIRANRVRQGDKMRGGDAAQQWGIAGVLGSGSKT